MENQRTFDLCPVAWVLVALLSACDTAPVADATPTLLRPANLGVTQVGSGQSTRYVYCEESACPAPTKKTPVAQIAPVSLPAKDVAERAVATAAVPSSVDVSVDVTFPFNSPLLSEASKKLLAQAVAAHQGARIEIIARSDFVGPAAANYKLMVARAKAMRGIVAQQAQSARITVRHEVAGSNPVAEAEQAQQRRGTVRFNLPIDVQLKGLPK
jgi:outer membrane protein OmpA-like peptidoglycan-associated protein